MTKKKGEMSDRFPNLSALTTATTKEIADEDSISRNFKVKKFTKESNFGYRKYETFDIVSETGDSIFTPTITSGSSPNEVKQEGQFYIHVDILEELCDQIKSIQKYLTLLCKDLVKAGVLKEV